MQIAYKSKGVEVMLKLGDKVRYIGVTYIVTEINDVFVRIKRERGNIELSVMRGSNRFKSIFPEEYEETENTRKFQFNEIPEVKISDKVERRFYNEKNDTYFETPNSKIQAIVERYMTESCELESVSEIKKDMLKELKADNTGLVRFVLVCMANRNLSSKYDLDKIIDINDYNNKVSDLRPVELEGKGAYNKLIDIFLASLQDDNDATDIEMEILLKQIPIKEGIECLTCICGYDWKFLNLGVPVLKAKQVQEVLESVTKPSETEEDSFEEFEEVE